MVSASADRLVTSGVRRHRPVFERATSIGGRVNVRLLGVKSIGVGLGGRAAVEDASAVWFNPAVMTLFNRPWAVTSGVPIIASTLDYTDHRLLQRSRAAARRIPTSDGGLLDVVPHLYVAHRLASPLWVGGGINSPAGSAMITGTRGSAATTRPAASWRSST